jgi:1-acyl-sn-glycerol-3-phosphate acyltransferase
VSAPERVAPPIIDIDERRWFYGKLYAPLVAAMTRYHRTRVSGTAVDGPAIYVTHHGAGYLNLDLVTAGYIIGWQGWHERGEARRPLRIVAAESRIEKALPGLPLMKQHFGLIDPSEASCLQVLERGEQLLVTPGGHREAQPRAGFYELRWKDRLGFVRLALQTGAAIVPLAVVGGASAYPGFAWKKLSVWSPLPLPARLDIAIGEPIAVPRAPERARDLAVVRPLHEEAWRRTRELYQGLISGRRGGP